MKSKIFLPVVLASALVGCAGGPGVEQAAVNPAGTGELATDLPVMDESGPIKPPMYVTGTFSDGQWMHQEHRRMAYKGNGIYQVVLENEQGPVNFQYASMGWKPQFSAKGYKMVVGQETELTRGGFMKDTRVTIPEDGRYIWSFKVDEKGNPVSTMISIVKE